MAGEFRQWVSRNDHLIDAWASGENLAEHPCAAHDDPAAAARDQRRVTDELDGVAQPLLGHEQDRAAAQLGAVPNGLRQAMD